MEEADSRVKTYLANVIYDAGKIEDSADILRKLIDTKFTFGEDEKSLFLKVWSGMISPIRLAIQNIEDCVPSGTNMDIAVNSLKEKLKVLLDEAIDIISSIVIPRTDNDEVRSGYTKKLADFLRYRVPCLPPEEREKAAEDSKMAYEKALDILKVISCPPIDLCYKIRLNYCILKWEFLNEKEEAFNTVIDMKKEAENSIEKYNDELKQKIKEIIEIMNQNLELWRDRGIR